MRSGYIKKRIEAIHVLQMKRVFVVAAAAALTFLLVMPAMALPRGKTVLGLYRSTEGYSEKDNPLAWFFQEDLKSLGLQVRYHDFSDDVPDISDLKEVRAVVTWFNGGLAEDRDKAVEYAHFLDTAIDKGVKVVIVNSYGAYGYREDGKEKWDLMEKHIKPLFLKMGFNFRGFWTNDPSRLQIVYRDPGMVEKDAKQNVAISKHYQQIVPVRDDVTTYLKVRRTDKKDIPNRGDSSVILTSRNGGFAMEQYVIRGEKVLLDMKKFIRASMFYDSGYQNVAVVIDDDLKNDDAARDNVKMALDYAKISSDIIKIKELENCIPADLAPYEAVMVAVKDTSSLPAGLLESYVKNGGRLVFIRDAGLNDSYRSLLGVTSYDNEYAFVKEGFTISPSFFMNNVSLDTKNIDLNVKKADVKGSTVLAKAAGARAGEYPVMWTRGVGKGKILYWNTDMLTTSKNMRGTIVQSLHVVARPFVTGLANIGMMMIDDFPAPWWNIGYRDYRIKHYRELLEKEEDSTNRKRIAAIIERLKKYPEEKDTDFIQDTWYNDIRMLEKKLGFKYSSYLIFNYNLKTEGDKDDAFEIKDFYLAEDNLSVKMGKNVLRNGWELGLHGFNHMSLTTTRPGHYKSEPWPHREAMEDALRIARREWIALYGEAMLPVSYVAPHNIIDDDGMKAIANVFPEIRVIAALYTSRLGERTQEFTWTEDNRFFQMPRITSGYYLQNYGRFSLYDAVHNMGVVSHFIHPDDVFDESRSKEYSGWNWLKQGFTKEFSMLEKNAPWLRWMTVKDAYGEMVFYAGTHIQVTHTAKTIKVFSSDGSTRDLYFRITLPPGRKVVRIKHCQIVYRNIATGDVVLKTSDPVAEISYR